MDTVTLNHQTLASLGLELADYDQMVGNFYDGALDPKVMGRTLCAVRSMFKASGGIKLDRLTAFSSKTLEYNVKYMRVIRI